jgi:WD40 repeat protein
LAAILTDFTYLEARNEAGQMFEVGLEMQAAWQSMPAEHMWQRNLRLLHQALRRHINWIHRHHEDYPQALFQCMWNEAWWYDCAEAAKHYDPPQGGWGPDGPPWTRPEPKLSTLLEKWRNARPKDPWMQNVQPPINQLGGGEIACLRGHEDTVTSLSFSHDGRRLASGSDDGKVRIWDVESGTCLFIQRAYGNTMYTVGLSPKGDLVVSGFGIDGSISLWDVQSGSEISSVNGHDSIVNCVNFSPDGSRIVSGSMDDTLRLWNAENGEEILVLRGHEGAIRSAAFSPSGRLIVSGSSDETVRIWAASSGEPLACLRGHDDAVKIVGFSQDSRNIFSANVNRILLWDANTFQEVDRFDINRPASVYIHAFTYNGKRAAIAFSDGILAVRQTGSNESLNPLGHFERGTALAFSPDASKLACGSSTGTIKVWTTRNAKPPVCVRDRVLVARAVFSPTEEYAMSKSTEGAMHIWDTGAGVKVGKFPDSAVMAFAPGCRLIAVGYEDGTLRICTANAGKELCHFNGHERGITAMKFSPDGQYLFSGCANGIVRVWDIDKQQEIGCLGIYKGFLGFRVGGKFCIETLVVSPDGRRLAAVSADNTVLVWDLGTMEALSFFRGHERHIKALYFSPDGLIVITSSCGGFSQRAAVMRVWEACNAKQVTVLYGERSLFIEPHFCDIQFSEDGNRIIAEEKDSGTVYVWDSATYERLEKIEECAAIEPIVNGLPIRALRQGNDIVLEHDGIPVAYYSSNRTGWCAHPSKPIYFGAGSDGGAGIVRLENYRA